MYMSKDGHLMDYEISAMKRAIRECLEYHEEGFNLADSLSLIDLVIYIAEHGIDRAEKGDELNADFNVVLDNIKEYRKAVYNTYKAGN